MIKRNLKQELLLQLKEFPVVTLLGPRQAGKTTLARSLSGYAYVNLETPEERALALSDPKTFLKPYTHKKVIFDEIQRVPELLSYIQVLVDEQKINGHFILTGSHQLELHQSISQSLAGRTGILTLLPLSIQEMSLFKINFETFSDYAFSGFLPRIYDQKQRPSTAYSAYYKTYIERDLRQLINIKDLSLFERFIKILAGRAGQLIDYSDISNAIGVSGATVKNWLSILESSFIIVKLNPYFKNFGKRVIKTPKYYFTEPGLLSYLLQIQNKSQITRDPLSGHIFENLIVVECIKNRWNQGKDHNLYFFRDSQKNEADLIIKHNGAYRLIEIKSSETFHTSFLKNFSKLEKVIPIDKKFVIYSGQTRPFNEDTLLLNFKDSYKIFE